MADPILERIHELPVAASWNGFFPQDKPGGPTECVSVATVEAKLVEDGFVKTAMLVAGYQPLENQRLRTTDSPTFAAGRIAGLKIQDDPVFTTYGNIYGSGIATPSDTNWSASFAKDGSVSLIKGSASAALSGGSGSVGVTSTSVNISNKLQIAGVDRITNAGGFVGTSLQISGATANKLARFDASKNLVSYDLTLTIGATGKTIDGTGNQSWSLAEIGAQAALSGGTTNVLPKWTGAGSLGNSGISDDGTTITASRAVNVSSGAIQIAGTNAITSARAGDLTALKVGSSTGFVRSAGGTYSASPLVAGDIPALAYAPVTATSGIANNRIPRGSSTAGILQDSRMVDNGTDFLVSTGTGAATSGGSGGFVWSPYQKQTLVHDAVDTYTYLEQVRSDNSARQPILTVTNSAGFVPTLNVAQAFRITPLAGATTRVATISAAGQIGATDSPNVTKLQIAGVDRITAAGGFIGTSLQISGATANKLARFDASKNLVSYDLVAADIPTLAYASSVNPAYSQSSVINSTPVSVSWGDPRNQIIDGTASAQVTLASFVAGSEYVFLRRQGAGSVTFSTAGAGSYIVYHNTLVATQNFTNSVIRAYCDGSYWYLD